MKKTSIIFSIILALAIFLRIFRLDSVPPALFGDEIDVGYQAYSLLKTGNDLTGRFLPFYIRSLTEFRTPLYIYSAIPFVGIFGLNEYGVRLPAAFWGIISVLGTYLLSKKLFGINTALIAMFLMAVSPWSLQYSRASFEATMLISFILFGLYFFLRGMERSIYFILTAILLISSIYIYSTAVVFVPLLLLVLLAVYWKQLKKISVKNLFLLALTGGILIIPLLMSMVTGEAKERFSGISIFQDTVLLDKINLARQGQKFYTPDGQIQEISPDIESIFYNKPVIFLQVFAKNYFGALSPVFLFSEGDINFRQGVHEMGELYYFEVVLLILGIFALTRKDIKSAILVFGWLLLAPIPSSLTYNGGYHATRLFLMLPPLVILSALGFNFLLEKRKKLIPKILIFVVVILAIFNMTFYFYRYYVHYGPESWRWWHVGFKEAMQYMKSEEQNYTLVGFNNTYEPSLIRFLFWNKVDPAEFQKEYKNAFASGQIFPDYEGFRYKDKYFFGTSSKGINEVLQPGTMYMVSARDEVPGDWDWSKEPPAGIRTLKTVRNPLNEPVFYVVVKE